MSDALTQSERLSLGMRAEHELSLTGKAFKQLRTNLLEALAATPVEYAAQREHLYLAVNVLPAVEALLQAYVSDAAVAQSEIDVAELVTAAAERRPPREAKH